MRKQKPSHLAVAFDPKGDTFRHRDFPAYKANREAQPEDIQVALPYVKQILEGFNIPTIVVDDYEADDVIGTLSKQAEREGFTVYMVTPDKDYAQLVSDNIYMYKPSRQGNGIDILGVPEILEKWDIANVSQVIDVLGLQGDSVDNIPGIPGIGAKTAVKLLKLYGSVEGLLANTDKLKGKQKEKVIEYAEQGLLSKKLATISLDVPIQFNAQTYKIENFDRDKLSKIFKELEFRTLAQQIFGEHTDTQSTQGDLFSSNATVPSAGKANAPAKYNVVSKNINNVAHEYLLVDTLAGMQTLADSLLQQELVSFDTETTSIDAHQAELVGLAWSYKSNEAYYVPVPSDHEQMLEIVEIFRPILEHNTIIKVGQNIKYDMNIMKWCGVDIRGPLYDTMISHYLSEPDLRHKLDYLAEAYLSYKMVPITDIIGKGKKQLTMRDVEVDKVVEYAGEDADVTLQIKDQLDELLTENKLSDLYWDLEAPLIPVLSAMEYEGVRINPDFLNNYSKELGKLIKEQEDKIYEAAGSAFNIGSPKQVGQILFDRLEIPYKGKKTSTGQYSTSVDKLQELAKDHPIVADILNYRKYSKLKSTYVDALPKLINPRTGRVHSSYNQARAATGRLSSENPNLQNIPIRDDAGREIRKAFEARDADHILLAADYSQIELRLIAEISKDEAMLAAFIEGNDFHRATAAKVYDVPYEEVTPMQRRNAKTVNFSITYGAGATNLSQQLDISRQEAKELIEQYFVQFAGLKQYMDDTVEYARKNGYVSTLLGRRRNLRDINSRNGMIRSNAERMAINTPIQGTAADMIKVAMINVHKALREQKLKSKMILQVHDELVFDVYRPELEQVKALVNDLMKNAMPELKVPIIVEMDTGDNWLEAH
jgi:DNA polymerase-1